MLKRTFDFAVSAVGLIFAAPVIAAAYAAVRLSSPGPGIFAQSRVGRGGQPFTCYKLRTMYAGTPNRATHETPVTQVTRVGAFLRKSKIDELPQLVNVLRGDMSLVGPRPSLPSQSALIEARLQAGVLHALPGITGLAQVHGVDMSDPDRLASIDRRYIETQSFARDIGLILATLGVTPLKPPLDLSPVSSA